MVQVIQQEPSLAGRIGKGFGKGLAEQVPQEIGRYRLSEGLRNLASQDFSNKSPLEQLAAIYNVPGMTPELAAQAQQQIQNRQFFGAVPEGGQRQQGSAFSQLQEEKQPQAQNVPAKQQKISKADFEEQVPSLSEKSANYAIPLNQDQIEQKAREEYQKNPQRFRSYQEYLGYAQQQDDKRVQKEQAFESRQIEADKLFEDGLGKVLQKQNTFKDLPGDLQRTLKNKMKAKVDAGMSAARAADETLKEVLPLVRARNDTAEATGFFNRWGKDPRKVRERLDNARDIYKKANALRVYRDDLIARGMDDSYANYLAYPVKEHKEINNIVSSLPKIKTPYYTSATSEEKKMGKEKKGKSEAELAKEIGPMLDSRDSILSIALALKGRGYDGTEFVQQIRNLEKEGAIELNERQKDELSKDTRLKPNLTDLFLFAKTGLDPLMEVK